MLFVGVFLNTKNFLCQDTEKVIVLSQGLIRQVVEVSDYETKYSKAGKGYPLQAEHLVRGRDR